MSHSLIFLHLSAIEHPRTSSLDFTSSLLTSTIHSRLSHSLQLLAFNIKQQYNKYKPAGSIYINHQKCSCVQGCLHAAPTVCFQPNNLVYLLVQRHNVIDTFSFFFFSLNFPWRRLC